MKLARAAFVPFLLMAISFGQIDKIAIPAGTSEDNDLNAIANEQDAQKKISMYQDFLQKYASNSVAVAMRIGSCRRLTRALATCKRPSITATKLLLPPRATWISSRQW